MTAIAHTIPFYIRGKEDITLADRCFKSLADSSPGALVVLYNQGVLSNEELQMLLKKYNLRFCILGDGVNVGIAQGRMACFQYIWTVSRGWTDRLVEFLTGYKDEPMVCPGIITSKGELHPEQKEKTIITNIPLDDLEHMNSLLADLTYDVVMEGFVHPVLHKSEVLKEVGGYDLKFLRGKQGYEDDSLLLGYRYYLGIKNDWKPKCCLRVRER